MDGPPPLSFLPSLCLDFLLIFMLRSSYRTNRYIFTIQHRKTILKELWYHIIKSEPNLNHAFGLYFWSEGDICYIGQKNTWTHHITIKSLLVFALKALLLYRLYLNPTDFLTQSAMHPPIHLGNIFSDTCHYVHWKILLLPMFPKCTHF